MALSTSVNNVKIYDLSAGKTLPEWLAVKKNRRISKDQEFRGRIELIQDLEFSGSCQSVRPTADGHHIVAIGTYPPAVRVYDVRELSMKFERRMDSQAVCFTMLTADASKLVFLEDDRTIEFHGPGGVHFRTRIPSFGRDMLYCPDDCDLLVCGTTNAIYRLNLDKGTFLAPMECSSSTLNTMSLNPVHNSLLACGGQDGIVHCFDRRSKKPVTSLQVDAVGSAISALEFTPEGMQMVVGNATGVVKMYDVRSSKPFFTKEHEYRTAIKRICFHNHAGVRHILSADTHVIKIWKRSGPSIGESFVNIEAPSEINDVCCLPICDSCEDSGLIFTAGMQSRVMCHFVPALGPAPEWCAFLDSITEELEESRAVSVYDNYKFVTREELNALGLAYLLGTPLLKAYMQGFFINLKLYQRAKAVAEPFAFEKWRKEKIREKVEKIRSTRISVQNKLPKVNAELAQRMLLAESSQKKSDEPSGVAALKDDRFARLFSDPAFQINEQSEEFRLRYPSGFGKEVREAVDDMFEPVEGEKEVAESPEEESDDSDASAIEKPVVQKRRKRPRMMQAKADTTAAVESLAKGEDIVRETKKRRLLGKTFGQRLEARKKSSAGRPGEVRTSHGGAREVVFVPTDGGKKGKGKSKRR